MTRRLILILALAGTLALATGCATMRESPQLDPVDERVARNFINGNEVVGRVAGDIEQLEMVGYGRMAEKNPLLFWRPKRYFSFFRFKVHGRDTDLQSFVKTRNLQQGEGWEVVEWGLSDTTYQMGEEEPKVARAFLRQNERMLEHFGEIRRLTPVRYSAIHRFMGDEPTQGSHQLRLVAEVVGSNDITQVLVLLEEDEEGRWMGREAWLLSELDDRIEEIRDIPL